MVKECFTTNDQNFAARPNMETNRHMVYNNVGFAPESGPYWREIRKLFSLELFTSHRLEKFKNVRSSEVTNFINGLSLFSQKNANKASVIDMGKWFENITFNITIKILAEKRFSITGSSEGNNEDLRVHEAIKKGMYLMGIFIVFELFSYLEWMDIGGYMKAIKQVAKEVDGVIGKWLDEHVERRKEYDG
ncbi:unnamed protein product [Lactuca virosa]|uniref:Cytochrome P450 n=1 Tax=Lactuca virosa TaxID=75947 RepID=A0AAU9PAP3_9ASTR|nr:unnamed protein product [Lactuca virosa]